jgi:hypothetical protein
MSKNLSDLLIDLADPPLLEAYRVDPEKIFEKYDLTPGDKAAIKSRNAGWIKFQTKLDMDKDYIIEENPSVIAGLALDVIDVIDVVSAVVAATDRRRLVILTEDNQRYLLQE